MKLTKKQEGIVNSFFHIHMKGQTRSHVNTFSLEPTYFEINGKDAFLLSQKLYKQIIEQKPRITYKEFEKEIIFRLEKIYKSFEIHKKKISEIFEKDSNLKYRLEEREFSLVLYYFTELGKTNIPFENSLFLMLTYLLCESITILSFLPLVLFM